MESEIRYENRKGITMTMKGECLIIKAPPGTPRFTIEKLVYKNREWIRHRLRKEERRRELESEYSERELVNLKKRALRILTEKTEYYAKIMGVSYKQIKINGAKTRFGSCSEDGKINYSYWLVEYPEAAIDCVVVHELAHLKEMNHSKRFYEIVAQVFPDYKARMSLLNRLPQKRGHYY